MCSIDALDVEPALALSAGMKWPPSRNDLMLDMRRREEAEGDRRMMGSGRLLFWLSASDGFEEMFVVEDGFLDMKGAASLRTWEKSCHHSRSVFEVAIRTPNKASPGLTVGLIPRKAAFRSPIFRSLLYITANRGSSVPLPDLPIVPPMAGACAPLDANAAAALEATPSLSPASGLMYSLSSLAPSSHVIRSNRSTKAKF